MRDQTIVVLGGGIGGLLVANRLRHLLPRRHRVIVVERNDTHAFAASFLGLMVGQRTAAAISRPVATLLRPGIELVVGAASRIDPAGRVVEVGGRPLAFDYLVVAAGAELAFDTIPGLSAAHTFYTLEGADHLHQALRSFAGGKIAVVVASLPYKCPGAPPEGAMLIASFMRQRGLAENTEVHLFTPEPQPMPVAGPVLGEAVAQMLADRGVAYRPQHKLTAVDPGERRLAFEGRDPVPYDLLVVIPPHRGSSVLRDAGLANPGGWVDVEPQTLATRTPGVFAIGDATAIPIPGRWKPDVPLMLPKAGVFAHAHAEVVARNIAAEIGGARPSAAFCGDGFCMLEAGEDLAGFAYGDFFAKPAPEVHLRRMGRTWHLGKVLFERWWLAPFGVRREALRLGLTWGGKAMGIPVDL
ncbi:MAG: NAD(P)/FAD-dependent oxidoreductase [Acidobacteria bacterium]|nr:NAD(P)/FAD-dependent oxidoreductase [Acidobacteriota bacterium]